MLSTITDFVDDRLHPYWVRVIDGVDTLAGRSSPESDEEPSRFGEKEFQCPVCGKVMHEGCKDDHLESHKPDQKEEDSENQNSIRNSETKVRKRDLLDDYELERNEEKESGIEIQEVDDNRGLKQEQLRKKWNPIIEELKRRGKVEFTKNDYYGTARGAAIVRDFKKATKRMEIEMQLEYDVDSKKSVIRVDGV